MERYNDRVVVYKGDDAQWYWRRVAHNGQIVSTGGEGYKRRWSARRAAKRTNPGSPIEVERVAVS